MMATGASASSGPPLLVPSLLWGGFGQDSISSSGVAGIGSSSLYKVPFHTLGAAKKRYLRLKPFTDDDDDGSLPWVEVALVDNGGGHPTDSKKYFVVKAAHPLAIVWDDPKPDNNNSLLSSPLFKRKGSRDNNNHKHEMLVHDIIQVASGNYTPAFQAFIAKNGNWSVPNESCCFSLVGVKRSVDFYVQSTNKNVDGRDAKLANAWKDSIRLLLENFHRNQHQQQNNGIIAAHNTHRGLGGSITASSTLRPTSKRWDPKLHAESLFDAAKGSDVGTLRWFFDNGCPVDYMDEPSGDTVLMVACRLGLHDVAQLALLGYNARNDPHPDFGKTALQTAVSAGHTNIVQLLLETAETSGADKIICNHEDENGEAPIHVASRCGSLEIMELLIMHGANLGLIDGRGRTCLHCASQAGQSACLSYALDSGLSDDYLETLSHDGYTPLHLAVRSNKTECVKKLLQAGVNVSAETAKGMNVYNLASKQHSSEKIMKLLLEYDVSEGYSSEYDSDDDSSFSGEDMFQGLNKYTVSPATKHQPTPTIQPYLNRYPNGSPLFADGGLVSPPYHQPQMAQHPMNHFNNGSPYAGAAAPIHSHLAAGGASLHSHWPQINHSPIVDGVNHRFASDDNAGGQYLLQQSHHVRLDDIPYHHASEQCTASNEDECFEQGEFGLGGELWKIYLTHDGHIYYYNINRDVSLWEDPRGAEDPRVSAAKSVSFAEQRQVQMHTAQPNFSEDLHESVVRNISGQNHDRYQVQGTSISYSTLTAIPQPGHAAPSNVLRMPLSPGVPTPMPYLVVGDSSSQRPGNANYHTNQPSGERSNLIVVPQHQTSPHHIMRSNTNNPVMDHIDGASKEQSRVDTIESNAVNSMKFGPSSIPAFSLKPASDNRESEPKSMFLAQIKSRAGVNAGDDIPSKTLKEKVPSSTPTSSIEQESANPKSMLLAHIKSRDIGTEGATQSSSCLADEKRYGQIMEATVKAQAGPSEPDEVLDSSETPNMRDPVLSKYTKMKGVGIPLPAIMHKMKQDGIDEATVDLFCSSHDVVKQPVVTRPREIASMSPKRQSKDRMKSILMQDEAVKKFMRMTSVGVPAQAVAHKMKSEGVDETKIDMFNIFHGLSAPKLPMPPSRQTPSKKGKYTNITKDDLAQDASFSKYVKMTKVGVPLMAIVTKMSQDGINIEKIQMFSAAYGLKTSIAASPKPILPPMPRERRRASKAMQKIHWTTVSEDRLHNSLWASEDNNAEDEIKDCEIEKLELLFSASPIKKRSRGIGKKKVAAKSSKKNMTLIDPKRANNIAIALAQFRAFANFDDLCQAVATLDGERLNVEKLQNMQLLLPRPDEQNSLKRFNGKSDGLGRAELFFLSVMKVSRFPQKLVAFKYLLQFDEQTSSLTSSLQLLAKACDEVVESKKLAGILRRLLAIGNLMNESAGKPQAKGITLDSLIKTAKKKGSDGKTTVLDLLVSTTMNNKLNVIDWWSDMPAIRDAMRLDLDDFRTILREIETGAQSVEGSIEAEKSQVDSQDGSSNSLDRSEIFLSKLVPFVEHVSGEIAKVKVLFSRVERKVELLCSFFAEDFKTCKASTIFAVLLDFSRLVDKSKESHIRKEKAEKRKESIVAKNKAKPAGSS